MYKKEVLRARWTDNSLIELTYPSATSESGEAASQYAAIRQAVSWPGVGISGAVTVLARPYNKVDPGSEELVLLAESVHPQADLSSLFNKVADLSEMFLASPVYLDVGDPCTEALLDFVQSRNLQIRWVEAPLVGDLFASLSQVKGLISKGVLRLDPGSESFKQATTISWADLEEGRDAMRRKFPLIESLRFTVAAFVRFPPARIRRGGRLPEKPGTSDSTKWMER